MHGVRRSAPSSSSSSSASGAGTGPGAGSAAGAEAVRAKKQKEEKRLTEYVRLEQMVLSARVKVGLGTRSEQSKPKEEEKEEEELRRLKDMLHHTAQLLALNPELYTVWNFRREIIDRLVKLGVGSVEEETGSGGPSGGRADFFGALREGRSEVGESHLQEKEGGAQLEEAQQQRQREEERRRENARILIGADIELTQHALRAHPKVYWIWNHRAWCLLHLPLDEDEEQVGEGEGERQDGGGKRKGRIACGVRGSGRGNWDWWRAC